MAPPPFFRPSTAAHPCQPAAFKRPGGPTRVRVRPRLDQTRSLPSLVSPRTYDPARGEVPSSRRMVAGPGFGRATQLNPRFSKVLSRPTNPADRSGPEPAVGPLKCGGALLPRHVDCRPDRACETPGREPLLGGAGTAAARPGRPPRAATLQKTAATTISHGIPGPRSAGAPTHWLVRQSGQNSQGSPRP